MSAQATGPSLPRYLKWLWTFARGASWLRSLALRLGRGRHCAVAIYPGAVVRCEDYEAITGAGRLRLGLRWGRGATFPSELLLGRAARLEVHGHMDIYNGARITVAPGARLRLGSGYINTGLTLDCTTGIHLGEGVAIAKGVTFRDGDGHELSGAGPSQAPIHVGDHVWIGMNATILKGVTIGDGAVVAAGAVVVRDVEPRTLVGGVPARVLRREVEWS